MRIFLNILQNLRQKIRYKVENRLKIIIRKYSFFQNLDISIWAAKLVTDFKLTEAVSQKCSVKKVFLEILPEACNFIKKEALAQLLSCEFCEISKNTFFHSTSGAASEFLSGYLKLKV